MASVTGLANDSAGTEATGSAMLHVTPARCRTGTPQPANPPAVLLVTASVREAATLIDRLTARGADVSTSSSVEHAASLAHRSFDLILVDAALPDTGAWTIVRAHRIWFADPPPILVLTRTPADLDIAVACIAHGATDYLPVDAPAAVLAARTTTCIERHRLRREAAATRERFEAERRRLENALDVVVPLAVGLTAEQDFQRLLERILVESMALCRADAGTLYLRSDDDRLTFEIMRTTSLGFSLGGTTGNAIPYPPLDLFDARTGAPNDRYIAVNAALSGTPLNIPDAYEATSFDFSGARSFDARTGYRSTSFLVVPLKNVHGRVIGVVQLINAQDAETGEIVPFDAGLQRMVESLSALAVVALESYLRVQGLTERVRALEVEIDRTKAATQVAEITETEYFQSLRGRAAELRNRRRQTNQ